MGFVLDKHRTDMWACLTTEGCSTFTNTVEQSYCMAKLLHHAEKYMVFLRQTYRLTSRKSGSVEKRSTKQKKNIVEYHIRNIHRNILNIWKYGGPTFNEYMILLDRLGFMYASVNTFFVWYA